jgi:hypothetical protein
MPLFCSENFERYHKNLEHLFGGNLYEIFLGFSSSVGVKYFQVDLNGRHVLRLPLV